MSEVWFWQRIISPHMAGLACEMVRLGCKVTYVVEQDMTDDRLKLGWTVPAMRGVDIVFAATVSTVAHFVQMAPNNSVHICQGIRSNGLISTAQQALTARGLPQWVVMESVDDHGWAGYLKRAEYRRLFYTRVGSLQGVLSIGYRTRDWVAALGVNANQIFPFAYFLSDNVPLAYAWQRERGPFRFVFSGQLIPRKRVDWLITALADLAEPSFELWIVGSGPQEPALRALAESDLRDRVRWLGRLPMTCIPNLMAQADCLVLPSQHDGWGAVVSEALMAGTPVICSDACGAAGVVQASGLGGVFPVKKRLELKKLLGDQLRQGVITVNSRNQLSTWAKCLGAEAGSRYLLEILTFSEISQDSRPVPPWRKEMCA